MSGLPENQPSQSAISTRIMSDPELGQEIKDSIIDDGGPMYNMYLNKRREFLQIYDQENQEKGAGALMIEVRGSNVLVSYLPTNMIQADMLSIIYSYIQVPLGTPGYKVIVLTGGDTMRVLEEYEQIISPNIEQSKSENENEHISEEEISKKSNNDVEIPQING